MILKMLSIYDIIEKKKFADKCLIELKAVSRSLVLFYKLLSSEMEVLYG